MAITGLLIILLLSTVLAWLLVAKQQQERPVKVMMFVGYFWLLAFCQFILLILIYLGWQRVT